MLTTFARLVLVGGIGLAAAACQGDGYGPPTGYQPAYNNGYYAAPPRYAYSQPAPAYYGNQGYGNVGYGYNNAYYNQGPRMTTVTVTNRGQNGYADQVVQQQVVCGSQYYDGYRQRYARC
jgi:hypothetical protein